MDGSNGAFLDIVEKTLSLFDVIAGVEVENEYKDTGNYELIFLAVVFAMAVLARLMFSPFVPVLFSPFMLLFGFISGLLMKHFSLFEGFSGLATLSWSVTLALFAPIILFHSAYGIDYHSLGHNIGHILLLAIPGTFFHCILVSSMAYPIFSPGNNWTFASVFGIAVILAPLVSEITITQLNGAQGQVRPLQLLLQGEQLVTITTAMYLFVIMIKLASYKSASAGFVIGFIAWQTLGVLVGIFFGVIVRYPFRFAYNDVIIQVSLAIGAIYFSYYVSDLLGVSGILAVVLFGVLLSATKIKISQETEIYTNTFWDYVLFVARTIIYVLAGVRLGYDDHNLKLSDLGFVIVLYILCIVARTLVYIMASPFLRKSGPLLSWKNIVVAIWGIYRGAPSLLMALVFALYYDNEFGFQVLVYTTLIVLLSLFLNVFLLRYLLMVLGLFDLSRSKRINMNMAVAQINLCRERAIFSLKLDRVISDANWLVVENLTRVQHPYKKKYTINEPIEDDFGDEVQIRLLNCPDCGGHTLCPPSLKELDDMMLEAKHRILKAQLVSYWRQYDLGILSRRGIRVLTNLVDAAVIKEDPMLRAADLKIQTGGSNCLRCMKSCFGHLLTVTSKTHKFIPTNPIRAMCFRLCASRTFQIIMAAIAMIDLGVLMHLTVLYYFRTNHQEHYKFATAAQIIDFLCFIIFFLEFVLQILGIGLVQYFRSHVNKVEFATGILIRACQITMYSDTAISSGEMVNVLLTHDIIMFLKTMMLFRVVRLYIFWTALIPKMLNTVDRQMDDDLMKCYDIGKAFLVGHERVMKFLAHVVCNETVYNNLRVVLESDRLRVTRDLGMIQKDRPSIAITMKTRHAIRHVINTMGDCINDLKEEGILDGIENKALNNSLEKVKKKLREISVVNPCPPDFILREIPWLHGDTDTSSFLLCHSKLSSYDPGDNIIRFGDDPIGLYVLVSGLVKSYYRPTASSIELSSKYGILPNYDYFINLKFDLPQEDYVVSGNLIGEMGLVTGRRYDMDVICETAVQVYYVPWKLIKAIVHESEDAALMQSKIWKSIGIKVAVNLLQYSSHFQGWLREKLLLYLQRSVIPMLQGVTSLNIGESIDDVILIEGVMMDGITRAIFFGPFHIPRTVHKIILPDSPGWNFDTPYETKILIIPNAHSVPNDILGPNGIFKDHYISHPEHLANATFDIAATELAKQCNQGRPHMKYDWLSSQRHYAKSRAFHHKKVGFIDFLPNIRGINDMMTSTTFVVHHGKRSEIRETPYSRKTQDSTITYVKDIDEQSEGEMARDHNKGIIKKKAAPVKRKRKVAFDGDHFGSLEGSLEQEMLLKRSKKKKAKARKKKTKKDKKKRDFRALLPPLPKVHVVQATPDDMRKSVQKAKAAKEGKKKMFIKMVSTRASSVDSTRDGPSAESSDLNYKTLEIIESVTTSDILGTTKLVQTNLQYRHLQLPVSDFMTSDARRFKFEPFKCSPPRTTLRYYYKMRSSSVTSSDESLRKWRLHEEESKRLMSVEIESAPGAKEILATSTSSGPRARFSSILEHVEPRSSNESEHSIKLPRKMPRDSIAPLRRSSLKKPKDEKPPEDRPSEDRPSEDKPTEDKPPENKPPENKPPENKPSEDKPPEDKSPETRPPEDKPPEDKSPETRPPEGKPPEDKSPETRPPEDKPPEDKSPETRPPEDKPPEDKPPETRPPADKPPEDKPPEPKPPEEPKTDAIKEKKT